MNREERGVFYLRVKHHYIDQREVIYSTSDMDIGSVLILLRNSGYRCIPVLCPSGNEFLGLIYKVTILEHKDEGKSMSLNVKELIKDRDAYISEEASFFKSLFRIEKLPFLAVTSSEGNFAGILPHSKVMGVLKNSFGMETGGYTLTIVTSEVKGSLRKLFSNIKKSYNIEGSFTLDPGDRLVRRVVITLDKSVSADQIEQLCKRIEKNGHKVVDIDTINNPER